MSPENETPESTEPVETPTQEENLVKEDVSIRAIYSDLHKTDVEKDPITTSVILASGTRKGISQFLDKVDKLEVEDLESVFTQDELVSVGINHESRDKPYVDDALHEEVNSGDYTNNVKYDGKNVGINPVNVKVTGRVAGSSALAKFTSGLGVGKHVTATLWHSGFSVVIAPPKEADIINLHYTIAKEEHRLGKETNNFIYSNYGVVINKLLAEFIIGHIVSSSLALPEDDSYLDYISMNDLNTLAIAMSTAMSPKGYPITVTCKNSTKLENDHPVCDFTASANVIPDSLLWVNRKLLKGDLLTHIAKTSPGSHTPESVRDYQNKLAVNAEKSVDVTDANGNTIQFSLQTPTLRKHIDSGEQWVQEIISKAEEVFVKDDSDDVKNTKIDTLVMTSILNKYNGYVNKIQLDDTYADDASTISSLLEMMSSDATLSNHLLEAISDHINHSYVSLVATYDFDCPKCKEAGRDSSQSTSDIDGFKEFIPLNAVEHFFDRSTLKFTQIVNRNQ